MALVVACNGGGGATDSGVDADDDLAVDLVAADAGLLAQAIELTLPGSLGRIGTRDLIHDGEHFAVVWELIEGTETDRRVVLARVSSSGEVVTGPLEVLGLEHDVSNLKLFATPGGYTLWYRGNDYSSPIWALRLDRQGTKLAEVQELESTHTSDRNTMRVAWSGQRFILLKSRRHTVSGNYIYRLETRIFGQDLVPLGSSQPIIGGDVTQTQDHPYITWEAEADNGNGAFFAMWREKGRAQRALFGKDDGLMISGPDLVFDTGQTQNGPHAALDGKGGALVAFTHSYLESPLFILVDTTSPQTIWSQPYKWLPSNRSESIDHAMAILGGDKALVAWQGNATTSMPQIYVGWADLASPAVLAGVVPISDPAYAYGGPSAAAGSQEVAVLFTGTVKGAGRLYLRLLSP